MRGSRIVKDLVLLGGGHSHVAVLRRFGMCPLAGLQITLISPGVTTPYSGMLPGVVSGHYAPHEAEIDLVRLCRFAGARLFVEAATGIDTDARTVSCGDRPDVHYDVLSLDIGITPDLTVPGASEHAIPVKPISSFQARFDVFLEGARNAGSYAELGVVGAGAGGVELVLALQHRLRKEGIDAKCHLFADDTILPGHSHAVRLRFEALMQQAGVVVHHRFRVVRVEEDGVVDGAGRKVPLSAVFWVTSAAPQRWLAETGLSVDEAGFLQVRETLQTESHDEVFGAGDTAVMTGHPRPRAGVFAVRQGRPLADNLRALIEGHALRNHVPQSRFLALISTGPKHAVASRGGSAFAGRWVWRWKDWIDRRFMDRFNKLPAMPVPKGEGLLAGLEEQMPCGGCAAKLPAEQLGSTLSDLHTVAHDDVVVGLGAPDDAAVVRVPEGHVVLHTVDHFRAFIDDPFLLGQIAANHALSDIYAMGAEATTALAIVTLPHAEPDKSQQLLKQLMNGAHRVLQREGVALVGGHTSEGAELALGFAVNGAADPETLMTKSALEEGDRLILTKPLGSGVMFAAEMQLRARGDWVETAIAQMLVSNRDAALRARNLGVRSATDVTGFGLAGHLFEMLEAAGRQAQLDLDALPALPGALELLEAGIRSSLHEDNAKVGRYIDGGEGQMRRELLFDPQTSGGLILAVRPKAAERLLEALREVGLEAAAIIGTVRGQGAPAIRLA